MTTFREDLADAIFDAHDEHAEQGREGCWSNAQKQADSIIASGFFERFGFDKDAFQ